MSKILVFLVLFLATMVGITVVTAIPMFYLWNYLAPKYFYFLPNVWLNIPFFDVMWLMLLFTFISIFLFGSKINYKKEN